MPAIGRPIWVGWYISAKPTFDLPAHCILPFGPNFPELIVWTLDGWQVAAYAAGTPDGSLAALNAAIASQAQTGLPVIAYWPRSLQTGPLPTGATYIGVEAYRFAGESAAAFVTRVKAGVVRCPWVVLVCQCYTSNALLTTDLASLPPLYAQLCIECPNIIGMLVFSGAGRATGLQDHLSVLPLWQELLNGIPGPPYPDLSLRAPKVIVDSFGGLIQPDNWTMDWHDGIGTSTRLFTKNGGLYVQVRNSAGIDQTGDFRRIL